ncbi:coiled-coil domain-containing protein [Pyrococcus kukulkanii]|uniref:coiled-coil domain-containing protein n=1 Tax=Pyrococcus kukulkanii TaxID=1609559 RepID=UPI00356A83E1
MKKLLFNILVLAITLPAALAFESIVPIGKSILIYDNNTLIYNITLDVSLEDSKVYAIVKNADGKTVTIAPIEWQVLRIGNISIVGTDRKDNETIKLYISTPQNSTYRVILPWLQEKSKGNATNTTTPTPGNVTTNITAPGNITTNITQIVIPENITCNSIEECNRIIANLTEQLKKLKEERDELLKQLKYLQRQQNMTQTENEQLKKQIEILKKALEEKNRRIRELEQLIEELEKERWSWETFKEKSEEQYLLWTPYIFPAVLAGLVVYYRRYKRIKKYMDVQIDYKAKELKEELLSEYLKKDLLKAKIETIVDDPNLLIILRTIIPQITGSQEITKGDILNIDVDQVAELAKKKFLLKENRVEYLKKKLLELKEKIKEEMGDV